MNSTFGAPSRARTGAGQARRGLIRGPPDHARERSTRLILDNRHPDPSHVLPCFLMPLSCRAMAEPRITQQGWFLSDRSAKYRRTTTSRWRAESARSADMTAEPGSPMTAEPGSPVPAGLPLERRHRPRPVYHRPAQIGQRGVSVRLHMPPAVHGGEGVLHDVFRGGEIRYQQGREPDECRVVQPVQRRHRMAGVVLSQGVVLCRGTVLRRRVLSVSCGRDPIVDADRPPGSVVRWFTAKPGLHGPHDRSPGGHAAASWAGP